MSNLSVAKTIWSQLVAGSKNKIRVMSWGVDTDHLVGDKDSLTLKVKARRHKGWVKITLNAMDTYDVEFIKLKSDKTPEVVDKIEGLYFDNLTEAIDSKIENIPANKF